jgi:hypothetical protein
MDTRFNDDDLMRLNALVDGELAPGERAAMAARLAGDRDLARAHATLARLKATVGELPDAETGISLPPRQRRIGPLAIGTAGCALAAALLLLVADVAAPPQRPPAVAAGSAEVTFASLAAHATVPRFDTAGLTLVGVAVDRHGGDPLVVASYRGPHGCRLDLRAWLAGAEVPVLDGTIRHKWTVGAIAYELVAHGMPEWRFAILSEAAERQTRPAGDLQWIEQHLRQAANGAPPCVG